MQMSSQPTVVFIDDEERILRTLTILFRPTCRVLATTDPQQVFAWVTEQAVDVVVSDQRMPAMSGSDVLARVREISPDTLRILLTGYSDIDAAVEALNEGGIWRYLAKPWTAEGIQRTVREAIEVSRSLRAATPLAGSPPGSPEVLVIDEDAATLEAVRASVPVGTVVLHATALTQAVQLIGTRPVGVIVSDVVVGGDDMTHLLRALKQQQPEILGIVLTAMRDTPRLVKLINQAQVFRFLPKPARSVLLTRSLASALERHDAERSLRAVPVGLRVEEPANPVERTFSERIGSYLARLRRPRETPA